MKKLLIALLGTAVLLQSCAKIFYTADASYLARSEKIMAIVPPTVSIAAKKNIDGVAIIEQQKTESVNFQREMYSWILKRKMQGYVLVDVQDVEVTNALLASAGFYEGKIMTPSELCNILGVDGIITSNYSLSKPVSEATAVATALVIGFGGATNEAIVSMSIHDQRSDKMIWNYDHKLSSAFGSPARLVDQLMREASRELPYFVPRYPN
jgi:hypothetical protein